MLRLEEVDVFGDDRINEKHTFSSFILISKLSNVQK